MMNPLPNINQAYSMLVTEESQRSIIGSVASESSLESTVLYSSSSSQQQSKGKKNWNIICEHCNVKGHKKESCYRLIGYPPDFKFTKKKIHRKSISSQ
ncbi:hypothetical protein Patl1_33394 [Pistacia atlantica]|uniref:Uncharacterized protein n=1 Tax=Pistacia atlantica TaxID=434234 RepID=A0ACC0ZRF0_9ROSI|nr:hypothetical protein Patl1_33394 [Pistacia atlantica]